MRRLLLALESPAPVWRLPPGEAAALRRDFPDLEVVDARSPDETADAIEGAEIVFSWSLADDVVARASNLRWLHSPAAGIGSYLTPSFRAKAPLLTNSRGVHAVPIAEHVMAMMLALARRLRPALEEQIGGAMTRERWSTPEDAPTELSGRTIGLYGYGAIAREVARRAAAFGMRVLALKRKPERRAEWDPELLRALALPAPEPEVAARFGPEDFDRFAAESDVIAITAPLTSETEGRFDARAFARMRPGSWLVNVARGGIVREGDLIEALRTGRPAAAALDVTEREPLPRESPLYRLENVILTPHVSGLSTGYWPRSLALFRANLRRYLDGRPLLNVVDPARGY